MLAKSYPRSLMFMILQTKYNEFILTLKWLILRLKQFENTDQNLALRSYKLGIAREINPFGIKNALIPLLYVQKTALITLRSPA